MWHWVFVLVVLSHSNAMVHRIAWTKSGLAEFTPENPLIVNIRDNVAINCSVSGLDIWIVTQREQFDACKCNILTYTCEDNGENAIDPCLPLNDNVIPILDQPAKLNAVNEFVPGTTYYLTSFPVNERSSNCNETGLRMAFMVAVAESTTPSSEEAPDTSTPNTNTPGTSEGNGSSPSGTVIDVDVTGNGTGQDMATVDMGGTVDGSDLQVEDAGLRVGVIAGTTVTVTVVFITVPMVTLALIIIFIYHQKKNRSECTTETFCYTEGQLDAVFDQDGAQVTMRSGNTVQQAGDNELREREDQREELKEDLSFSQSLQTYEPMREIIRTSQSNLLKAIEEKDYQNSDNSESPAADYTVGMERDAVLPSAESDRSKDKEFNLQSHYEPIDQPEEDQMANYPEAFKLPIAAGTLTTQQSDESSDLINLQTPTHSLNFSPQSSIASFTGLAEMRVKKAVPLPKQASISEDTGTAEEDAPVAQEKKPFTLTKSQSEEFLDKIGTTSCQPQALPRGNKLKNSSMENLADIDNSKRPVPKPRTLPRPKLAKKKEKTPPPASSQPATKALEGGISIAQKRHSGFEKSGEVFSLVESL